jgi:hypothetical protein
LDRSSKITSRIPCQIEATSIDIGHKPAQELPFLRILDVTLQWPNAIHWLPLGEIALICCVTDKRVCRATLVISRRLRKAGNR